MKQARRSLYAVIMLFLLFMMQQLGMVDSLISGMEKVDWWVYLLIAGILFSGYQAFTVSRREEAVDDEETIEKQGNIYIRRMKDEKKRRHRQKDPKAMH
ncbi:signal peptidase [Sporolactobacillus sp. THM7-7]|nr:signal peptidase [Sporolactobacillus sp. THM7-7]